MGKGTQETPILEAKHISKSFAGPLVLKDVNFSVYPGKVTALIGENGAGKSTLMKILSGVYTDYEGQVVLRGDPVRFDNPRQAQEAGISIILQELNVLPNLTIAENIFLGREPETAYGTVDKQQLRKDSKRYLEMLKMEATPETKVSSLKVAQQQLVEIAGALSYDAKILIMDEPTSALSDTEVEILFDIIREYKKQGGAVVYISHKLEELFEISDEIVVMRDGEIVDTGHTESFDRNRIVKGMVGREARKVFIRKKADYGEEVFRVSDFELFLKRETGDCNLHDISFSVRRGEIVGIFGLMGAGRTELLEGLFGAFPKQSKGTIFIEGQQVAIRSVEQAIRAGMALVPEDRKTQGLFLGMSVSQNLTLAALVSRFPGVMAPEARERELVTDYINKLNIDTPSPTKPINQLSGGNQQKVVISKWLATQPNILFLDEPTRGIDVNAKREVYELINQLAEAGKGILLVSSELPEILTLSDRILVLANGTITADMDREEATKEKIMHAAIPNR
ncbi:sugar ABC transporter ATP-binding protein [Aliifodinibius sp. S!AR15-10]|uniref:sugar ABC transporter ATP-binding protein n=1 Tax=Aliifodinibius sp. S!AR15-10 TaxID=2950437 RepID=UPI00286409D7|nr:ATP-binding cassette domain-containing protein [Aliifodinibius sp. S!AR15-10]MDR8389816.1 sugar ABC transporter ATP-binding protein [Aliifodinibius sp. S!AR15-10]